MLRLDIGSLPDGLTHVDLTADTSEWGDVPDGGRLESPVRVSLDVTRNGRDIFARGSAGVMSVLECGRCLEEYVYALEAPIELWVIVGGEPDSEERENVIEVPAGAGYADLTGHVRSELLLQVPLKQLCRADCRGLCPVCGANLNSAPCGCRAESHDARWEDLRNLKEKP
jgi:uncharacterized protein